MRGRTSSDMVGVPRLALSVVEAAWALGRSEEQVRALVKSGLIATVPHLSSPKKQVIAVAELERFVSAGVMGVGLRSVG